MIYAYSELYRDDAMDRLGGMLDFAVNDCAFNIEAFLQRFVISGVAAQFEKGNPRYVSGFSGEELVHEVVRWSGLLRNLPEASFCTMERTPEYWCGWILAYYQWKTVKPFARIIRECPGTELLQLYPVLHEASEERAAEALRQRAEERHAQSQLQRLRVYAGMTQAVLAERSGVSLRSIQMYEQRRKDINKAQAMTLFRLADALACGEEDLLE